MSSRFNNNDYVSLTMEFRCNLKCVHCMIEGTMDWLEPQSKTSFDEVLRTNLEQRCWKGLILTGSEITLRKDLPDLARQAKKAGFEHVRIQTHGMHLGQPNFCDRLIDAGIDEFFVSVAGCDAKSHDEITQVPGSFDRMMNGMAYLDQFEHVSLLTNTVVTRLSYKLLPQMVHNLAHLRRLEQMEFWNYWPMNENDDKDLIAAHGDVLPYITEAARSAQALGRAVEIKNFPQCLLGELGHLLENDQPKLHIDERFWTEFQRNGFYRCAHREQCSSKQCLGLNEAYTRKFGWEAEQLSPIRPAAARLTKVGYENVETIANLQRGPADIDRIASQLVG